MRLNQKSLGTFLSSQKSKAFLALFLVVLIWGSTPCIMKICYLGLEPATFNLFRLILTNLFLFILIYIRTLKDRSFNSHLSVPLKLKHLILGAFTIFPYFYLFLLGLKNTTSSMAGIMIATVPIWTIVLGCVFSLEKPKFSVLMGTTIALIGVLVFFIDHKFIDNLSGFFYFKSNLLILLSAVFFSIYIIFSRKISQKVDPILSTYYAFGGAIIPMAVIALGEFYFSPLRISLVNIFGIVYMALLGSSIGYVFFLYSIKVFGAYFSNIFLNIIPLIAFFLGVFFLNEIVTKQKIIAGVIIIVGIVLTSCNFKINHKAHDN